MLKLIASTLATVNFLIVAFYFHGTAEAEEIESVSLGRAVYIREGCIHCHSQYVRKEDELTWGPLRPEAEMRAGSPPLIGNRRNGPDLLNVGNRRSSEWLRLFLHSPQLLRAQVIMPSYSYLFETDDGEHLVQYLSSLGKHTLTARKEQIKQWKPQDSVKPASEGESKQLFSTRCAVCHGSTGQGDGPLSGAFAIKPRNLVREAFRYTKEGASSQREDIARIIKFGTRSFADSSMPGAEYLSDADVLGIADYVQNLKQTQP